MGPSRTKYKEAFPTKNNITELVFILDRSGSMAGLESDAIGQVRAAAPLRGNWSAPISADCQKRKHLFRKR